MNYLSVGEKQSTSFFEMEEAGMFEFISLSMYPIQITSNAVSKFNVFVSFCSYDLIPGAREC